MAQRTGAERFLASFAKSASARAILALALAALALAGCGGSSSGAGEGESTGTATAGAEAGSGGGAPESSADSAKGKDTATQAQEEEKSGTSAATGSPQGEGQKQGPRVPQPKGKREAAPTPQEITNATVADITLESYSPYDEGEGPASLPTNYTCDGEDKWPQFHWSGVPAGTAEVALYAMNVQPVDGKLFIDWAVAGLDPDLPEIVSGRLPKGAVVGTNSFGKQGYSLCPQGKGEIYMFALFALPKRLGLRPGFDAHAAREEILEVSGNAGLLPMLYAHH